MLRTGARVSLLVLMLLAPTAAPAEERAFQDHVSFTSGPFELLLINWEKPRGKNLIVVHFKIENPTREAHRCNWRQLISLRREDGSVMWSNYDVLVDTGTGLTRASGPFLLEKKSKARFSVPFFIHQTDLPARLELEDGRRSVVIR